MTREFIGRTLILVFENGLDALGNLKFVQKTLRNISESLTDADLCIIGDEISKMYPMTLSKICLDEDHVLANR